MSSVFVRREASWAPVVVALFAALALGSIVQGIVDFTIPVLTGTGRPFALTMHVADTLGAAGLFGSILFHNLGLALLIPGCGLLAARLEREPAMRRQIAPILLVASGVAVAVGVVVVLRTTTSVDRTFALALGAGEAMAILSVGVAAHRELKRFRTRAPDAQGYALALRALRGPILLSFVGLAALAMLETTHVLGVA